MQLFLGLIFSFFLTQSHLSIINDNLDGPGARWGHVFIYSSSQNHILLFGGAPERGRYLGDTWIWDGEKWEEISVEGPPARGFCAAAFHEGRGTIVIHGRRGNGNVTYADTWEWNGSKWEKLDEESFKVDHHEMVYVSSKSKLVAFGGWDGEKVLGDTWEWDNEWKKLETESPPPRSAFGMAYDKKKDKIQLHGGLWINGQYADIWEWSDGTWSSIGGPYDNSSLDHHSMIYEEKLGRVLIFGGKNYRYTMQQKTLTIDGQSVSLVTQEGPTARHSIGLTYDNQDNVTYLFGGKIYQGKEQLALDDFWKWNGQTWEKLN